MQAAPRGRWDSSRAGLEVAIRVSRQRRIPNLRNQMMVRKSMSRTSPKVLKVSRSVLEALLSKGKLGAVLPRADGRRLVRGSAVVACKERRRSKPLEVLEKLSEVSGDLSWGFDRRQAGAGWQRTALAYASAHALPTASLSDVDDPWGVSAIQLSASQVGFPWRKFRFSTRASRTSS